MIHRLKFRTRILQSFKKTYTLETSQVINPSCTSVCVKRRKHTVCPREMACRANDAPLACRAVSARRVSSKPPLWNITIIIKITTRQQQQRQRTQLDEVSSLTGDLFPSRICEVVKPSFLLDFPLVVEQPATVNTNQRTPESKPFPLQLQNKKKTL